jgi:hypothetical protein
MMPNVGNEGVVPKVHKTKDCLTVQKACESLKQQAVEG